MKCRHCGAEVTLCLADLATSPPSNAYLTHDQLNSPETWYPLRVLVCERCWLAQTEDYAHFEQLFSRDYAYFSSFSTSWLEHAQRYVASMVERFGLNGTSHVVEVAANDGYLLQYVKARGVPCLGIEPTASTAKAARSKGIEVLEEFFGARLADKLVSDGRAADLIAANNVLAHVPDINDFVSGFARLLKPTGVATFEFPSLFQLVRHCQFDTIYHEHFSYLSLSAVSRIFAANGLTVFDVEELDTHGGSLRVFAQRRDVGSRPVSPTVNAMLQMEADAGMTTSAYYAGFQPRVLAVKDAVLNFLLQQRAAGHSVVGYGAAAKGNTLLNFAGVRSDLLPWVVDRNPAKRDNYLPGSRIPVVDEARLTAEKPRYILILPWNLTREITAQLHYARAWGAQFVTAVPELKIQ
jgi:predicted TPR repeat methyltransferase